MASFIPLASPKASYILYIKYYTEIIFATEKIKFPSVIVFDLQSGMQNKKMTSDFMAGSIGTNPVIVRKILQQLKAEGLVEVSRGTGGVTITRPLNEITFLDIYRAVECTPDEELFHFHENPNSLCPVGRNIHHVLDDKLARVQSAMEKELAAITLADVKKDTDMWIAKEEI